MPFYVVRSESADEIQTIALWELESWQTSECGISIASGERVASAHADKADALAVRLPHQTIVFRTTDDQTREWQSRERARFNDGTYAHVPWADCYWSDDLWCKHLTHMSTVHPGLIAYTPDDDHGVRDRQVRTTVQKYFAKFFAHIPVASADIERWSQQVKAFDGELKIATTPDDIVNVYTHGPDSCMAHPADSYYSRPHHPCEVYGDSDLGVAYLGDPASGVSARAIVWMAEKHYGRIYGDETLGHVLRAAGYTQSAWFEGAKVRAITDDRGRWIMPYTDIANSAKLTRIDGVQWFVLSPKENNAYGTRDTNGLLYQEDRCDDDDEDDEITDCERCGSNSCHGGDDVCESCRETQWRCSDCQSIYFDDGGDCSDSLSPTTVLNHRGMRRRYCESCESDRAVTCELCDETFYPSIQFSAEDITDRESQHVHDLCVHCAPLHAYCAPCEWYYKRDGSDVHCTHVVIAKPVIAPIMEPTTVTVTTTFADAEPIIINPIDGLSYRLHVDSWSSDITPIAVDRGGLPIELTDALAGRHIRNSTWRALEIVGEWIDPIGNPDTYRYPPPYRPPVDLVIPSSFEVSTHGR